MPLIDASCRLELGKQAETAARDFLIAQGLRIILENFRCRTGELDLVALHDSHLVIVEVRLRTQRRYASAAVSVGPIKRKRIIAATRFLLLTRPQLTRYPVRFDVVAFDRAAAHELTRLEWVRNAFEARAW